MRCEFEWSGECGLDGMGWKGGVVVVMLVMMLNIASQLISSSVICDCDLQPVVLMISFFPPITRAQLI